MTLSKKHFKAIAEILKKYNSNKNNIDSIAKEEFNILLDDFIIYFQNENENFNTAKFKEAVLN